MKIVRETIFALMYEGDFVISGSYNECEKLAIQCFKNNRDMVGEYKIHTYCTTYNEVHGGSIIRIFKEDSKIIIR